MRLDDMRAKVSFIIQDVSYTDDMIDEYINEVVQMLAEEMVLPGMRSIDTVTTDGTNPYVTLANVDGGFSGMLRRVKNSDGENIEIYPNLDIFIDDYPDMTITGDVEAVCLEGSILWYAKLNAETLTILYVKSPAALEYDQSEPTEYPSHLHERLFVNGAASVIFGEIEEDEGEAKVNTAYYYRLYEEAKKELQHWMARNRRHVITSVWRQ